MLKVFSFENFELTLNLPELLLIPEFKQILDMDFTAEKTRAFRFFTYAYLRYDWQSPYSMYVDEEEKSTAAMVDSGLTILEIEQPEVKQMCEKYLQLMLTHPKIGMVNAIKQSLDKYRQYFETVNFTEKVSNGARKGMLLHDPKQYLDVIAKTATIFETIDILEKTIKEELQGQRDMRGDGEPGWEEL